MGAVSSTERTRETPREPACAASRLGLPGRLDRVGPTPALDWARSGAMALTGEPNGPPLLAPAAFATALARALSLLTGLAEPRHTRALGTLNGPALLGEHAACLGLARHGTRTPGGSGQLLKTASVPIALQLAREDDVRLLEAWLETPQKNADPWRWVRDTVRQRSAGPLVARGREIGLALAAVDAPPAKAPPWVRIDAIGLRHPGPRSRARVVDLSSLWAGPLCAHLLGKAGAEVIKVESTRRPDGARRGPPSFFDGLNAGKRSVCIDFGSPAGLRALRALIGSADLVVEASRPRALAQLGVDADRCLRARPGTTWISLTGYGREGPGRNWIGFGDDAAVAAGTTAALRERSGHEVFCGDALADPLAGVHAALAGLASFEAGGGHRLDLSLRDVTAAILVDAPMPPEASVQGGDVSPPRAREPEGRAAALGADTADVLRRLPC